MTRIVEREVNEEAVTQPVPIAGNFAGVGA